MLATQTFGNVDHRPSLYNEHNEEFVVMLDNEHNENNVHSANVRLREQKQYNKVAVDDERSAKEDAAGDALSSRTMERAKRHTERLVPLALTVKCYRM